MRPLNEEETRLFFEKLAKYIGRNIKLLVEKKEDDSRCFRLHKNNIYYVSEEVMKKASNIARTNLISLGVCMGKFTKSGKFRLKITALDYLAQYAIYKVWVKPSAEMSYLYGNHILKAGLGRITENTPRHQACIVYNMQDIPIGFGVTAYSTQECRKLESQSIVCYHQADIGEYLREDESTL